MERSSRAGTRNRRLAIALIVAFALPAVQSAYAVDIYYARAIGQEYLPEPNASTPPPAVPEPEKALPELPGLGARDEPAAEPRMSTWTKVLIGTVLVAAIAALGDRGAGSAGVSVGTAPPPPAPAPDNPGDNSGGGGGIGIDAGVGIDVGAGGSRGGNRGRDDDDDDDDDD